MSKSSRFDVVLNEKMTELFDSLAKEENLSRTEIFKRAIATYHLLKQQTKSGAKVFIKTNDKSSSNDRELLVI